jgi:hypothetical protein
MKIVINSCFGGFGLSKAALYELYLKGSPLVEDVHNLTGGNYNPKDEVIPFNDFSASFNEYSHKLRCHPDLVEIVEKLGEKASGMCADLNVVEIPDGIDWIITDYDGIETIGTK